MEINSEKIRAIRKNLNLNQKDFAKLLGRSQNTISQWENGLRSPDFASIEQIARCFNLPLEEICLSDNNISISDQVSSENILNSNYIYDVRNGRIYAKSDLKNILKNSFDDITIKKIGKSNINSFVDEIIFVFAIDKLYGEEFNFNHIKLLLNFLPKELLTETSQIIFDIVIKHIVDFKKNFNKIFKVDINGYIESLLKDE